MESNITLGVTTDPFREDIVDRHERGFNIVEIRLSEPLLVGHTIEFTKELARVIDEYDMEVSSIHVPEIRANGIPVDFSSLDEENRMTSIKLVNRTIDLAYDIPTRRVVLTLPPFLKSQIFKTDRIKESLKLARYRCFEQLRTYVERTEAGGISLCVKNPPPIISKTPEADYYAISGGTPEAIYDVIRKLDGFRVWIALDIANAHLFSNAMIQAYWPDSNIRTSMAWIKELDFQPLKSLAESIKMISDHIEILYLNNAQGFTERGLLPTMGEIEFITLFKELADIIFPERPIIIDVEEKEKEKAINAEITRSYINNQLTRL